MFSVAQCKMQNKSRLYVHEVFLADNIEKGNTLQTAASQPHGGITLYKDILANVLAANVTNDSETSKPRFSRKPGESILTMRHVCRRTWIEACVRGAECDFTGEDDARPFYAFGRESKGETTRTWRHIR